ncbi:putative exported protein [Rahnella aquatilis CIP 78.65 = ATCC 33071]|uniref:Uncharacterized protein n=1 Tax=Rahnella aquatilis (strain ATCC 33071 / DSM 4594 / JCM 1683 / NBRC 105701 / NCIMB 13365 / CIP 78.65) TaxID=745277 RepID=H2IWN5_RAHAC|nr:hypothetical protein [Rahnella aquatilis]AEX54084.1 hypothetical protein Rahaq2_4331 [Rahnella aquatilis CIP 78.65 = ATCC 33071]KFD00407.1 putative exported protein [Rahnella aquatilis CIP 78.65 = ATCC 33071]
MSLAKIILLVFISTFSISSFAIPVNTAHLDSLYEQRMLPNGKSVGIIHIYSEYPKYGWVKDPIEGVSAIDDISRALVFYTGLYSHQPAPAVMNKIIHLTRSILMMQAENGYFYNFIYPDNSINTTYKTSVAEPNWWTWRALWALASAYPVVKAQDETLAAQMHNVLFRQTQALTGYVQETQTLTTLKGITLPVWMPNGGADQAAILLLALTRMQQISPQPNIEKMMRMLASGIMTMQIRDVTSSANGVFLSWKNTWHGYGNNQAYALLEAGTVLNDRDMVKAAFYELDNFHPWLISQGYLTSFSVSKTGESVEMNDKQQFSQIAYIFRPMIFANLRAYEISRDTRYIDQAVTLAMWFYRGNVARIQMYLPDSGLAFDGLDPEKSVNRNSGAESTIETLLALDAIERSPLAKKQLEERLSRGK